MTEVFTLSPDEFTESVDVFTESLDEFTESIDGFTKIKEIKPLKELPGFKVVKHKQHSTTSIYVVHKNLEHESRHKYCTILDFVRTKYGDRKANVRLQSSGLVDFFKKWETLINGGLEIMGFPTVTLLWGNRMYPKTKLTHPIRPESKEFILKSVFINKKSKAYQQLWLE